MRSAAAVTRECVWKTDAARSPSRDFSLCLSLLTVERVRAEAAQAAAKMLEEMQIRNQQIMEQKEKSYQEHVRQLAEKMEKDRAQMLEEQERTMALKLQVLLCMAWGCCYSVCSPLSLSAGVAPQ